jgi:glutamate formiminotransferase/formiminotetrahydrofolate cyclodeaminase
VLGAHFNVKINAKDLKNRAVAEDLLAKAKRIYDEALVREAEAIAFIESKM